MPYVLKTARKGEVVSTRVRGWIESAVKSHSVNRPGHYTLPFTTKASHAQEIPSHGTLDFDVLDDNMTIVIREVKVV
jgi:hypothetical protein